MTRNVSESNLGSSVVYEDSLPLKIEPCAAAPETGELLRVGLLNDEVLRMVLSLDDLSVGERPDDERSGELQRLEFKVNLILDMLGELYAQRVDFPAARSIKLGALSVAWQLKEDDPGMAPGACVSLHLYLTQRYPRPLVLHGKISRVFKEGEQMGDWLEVALLPMPQQTQDSLEKFVFRQHRRSVAFSRRQGVASL